MNCQLSLIPSYLFILKNFFSFQYLHYLFIRQFTLFSHLLFIDLIKVEYNVKFFPGVKVSQKMLMIWLKSIIISRMIMIKANYMSASEKPFQYQQKLYKVEKSI